MQKYYSIDLTDPNSFALLYTILKYGNGVIFNLDAKSKLLIIVTISTINMMIMTFIPLNHIEAQNPANIVPKDVNPFSPLFCDQDAIDNNITGSGTTVNFSSDEVVSDIRCHLREARDAIAAGASDSALLQISEAEEHPWFLVTALTRVYLSIVVIDIE